jgi:tRNA threonylcarbamoyladenosine biosynthesis protein TsaB
MTPAQPGRWLAIETSGLYGSLAAGVAGPDACDLVAEAPLPHEARSAQTLAPTIQSLLADLSWSPSNLTAVAIAVGPGSFTGLRVGVTTAKTLAWATGAAAIGVDTLDALAFAAASPATSSDRLWTVLDAQRRELFVARYTAAGNEWKRDSPTSRMTAAALTAALLPSDRVVGPPAGEFGGGVIEPQAAAVLQVAWRRWRDGAADSVFALAPQYHRLSAAEEKLVAK